MDGHAQIQLVSSDEGRAGPSVSVKTHIKAKVLKGVRSVRSRVLRLLDLIISVTALFYLIPLFFIVAALIKLEDGGPIFFVQGRLGKHGREFPCFKFRTMRINGDDVFKSYLDANPHEAEAWVRFRKLEQDPRVTKMGRFLRKTSLDEFPQLLNVVLGQMSLVGPRPIMVEELKKYGASFRIYVSQLPGITGLWQIMGRNKLSYLRRIALDRVLARKLSVPTYFGILCRTVPAVLLQSGAR